MRCVVLDGWHKGHMVELPEAYPQISLVRPPVVTIDDCCDGEVAGAVPASHYDYRLAFRSVDGKTALYTQSGSSLPFVDNREWITPTNSKWLEQTLYVGIHDHRAITRGMEPNV